MSEHASSLPAWATPLTNGSGRHSSKMIKFTRRGEVVAGEVVGRGRTRGSKFSPDGNTWLDVRVEAADVDGLDLEPGAWARIMCGVQFLRELVEADDPQVGDRLVVQYDGRLDLPDGSFQHLFSGGVAKAGSTTGEW
jgi:hypothetical protein